MEILVGPVDLDPQAGTAPPAPTVRVGAAANTARAPALPTAPTAARRQRQPPPTQRLDTDGHIPRAWFRRMIWNPALQAAGITFQVRFEDLRHAHASCIRELNPEAGEPGSQRQILSRSRPWSTTTSTARETTLR
jgi:hypothetical protein